MTMREILFRGKEIGIDRWVHGSLDKHKSGIVVIMSDEIVTSIYSRVDPDTVGQYTGLTDKNGKKIFEGDIVRAVLPKSNAIPEFVWPNMVVGFSEGAFTTMRGRYSTPLYSFAPAVELEVIGSIHDNPELMEGK